MATNEYIPIGRTSRIQRNGKEIQVQTEYAGRPSPRLTTSVINKGQVLHKIQRELEAPISNDLEKSKVERLLNRQHLEVIRTIESKSYDTQGIQIKERPPIKNEDLTLPEKLRLLDGVAGVFHIDVDGNFETKNISKQFKKRFAPIFKNLLDVMNIFAELPGGKREQGVVEVEKERLYLISSGGEFYFLLHKGNLPSSEIELQIQNALLK